VTVKGLRSRSLGTKTAFLALSAACVWFMFGKTSLVSSFCLLIYLPKWNLKPGPGTQEIAIGYPVLKTGNAANYYSQRLSI